MHFDLSCNMVKKLLIISFLATVFSLPFPKIHFFSLSGYKVIPVDILFLITSGFFVLSIILGTIKIKLSKFYFPLILFLTAVSLSTFLSINFQLSLPKMLGLFYLVGLSIITFNLIDEINFSRQVCIAWLLGSLIAAIITVITIFLFYFDRTNIFLRSTLSTYGTLPPGNYPRINSSFLNANMFCHYLSISWTILLISYQFEWVNKPFFFILSILFGTAVIFTISPSIGGVLLIIGLFGGIYYREKSSFTFSRISFMIGICSAIFFFIITTITIGFEGSAKANTIFDVIVTPSVRVQTWQSALQTFVKYPICGQGIATNAAEVVFISPAGEKQFLTDAHQMWLNVAAQEGLFGVFAITFLGIYLLKRGSPFNFKDKKSILRTGLAIGFLSTFFYQGLTGSYEDARHLWILIGFLGAVTEDNFDT